jgi:hypothetical protein
MRWQVVMPVIGPQWNLEGFLSTVGAVNVPFLIVDNSPSSFTDYLDIPAGIEVEKHPENLGVAASWNRGVHRGADLTLVLSSSIRFADGGLQHLIDYADEHANQYGLQFGGYPMQPDGLWNVGWKCIVFGRELFDLVGCFDENFFPGYFEDLDFSYRTFLALGKREFPLAQGDSDAAGVSKVGDALAVSNGFGFPEGVRRSGDVVRDYFLRKWGGPSCEEKYWHPFNDENRDIRYWPSPPSREYPGPGE